VLYNPMRRLLFLILFCLTASVAFAQEASMDNLPLPRWAVIAVDEINLRTGPGKRYPIDWVIKKKGLPVEVTQEFDTWRLIHEPGGSSGWVNRTMLSSVHNIVLQSNQSLFAKPDNSSHVLAMLQKGVIGRAVNCAPQWCRIKVESYEGWVPKDTLWGVYPQENFE
jgi:SH3-like domain-containing protein